jgi:hypothetical protein
MGNTKGLYREEFPPGTYVQIADLKRLEEFKKTWLLHNPLTSEQLSFASSRGTVSSVGFYHGGDELYVIEGIPGVWHEACLALAENSK